MAIFSSFESTICSQLSNSGTRKTHRLPWHRQVCRHGAICVYPPRIISHKPRRQLSLRHGTSTLRVGPIKWPVPRPVQSAGCSACRTRPSACDRVEAFWYPAACLHPATRLTCVVFCRGLHCPICAKYLLELERVAREFASRGMQVVAISSDDADRGRHMAAKVNTSAVKFGYGMSLKAAPEWGLYISASRGKTSIGIEDDRAVFRAEYLHRAARPHAVLRCHANHPVCPPPVSRSAGCD